MIRPEASQTESYSAPSIDALVEKFREELSQVHFARASDAADVATLLVEAATAVLTGNSLVSAVHRYSTRQMDLLADQPQLGRLVLGHATVVLVAAAVWAETNLKRLRVESALHSPPRSTIDGDFLGVPGAPGNQREKRQLERLAYYDELTDLPNRMHFRERLDAATASLRGEGERVAAVFLDLDHFKTINDRFGHDGGDYALVGFARRILEVLRPGEMVARLGGDEFAVLIEQATPERAMQTANRVIAAIAHRFADDNRVFNLVATAGVAISSPLLDQPAEILRAADLAMYQGKQAGGGVATLFQPWMYDEAFARAELERDLRLALDRQEMEPWFLPEFDLESGAVCGFEVQVRWRRPDGQLLTPGSFIDVAFELGIIVPLGLNIWRAACAQLKEWSAEFPHIEGMAITFSASSRDVAQSDYPLRVAEILRETGLDPSRLGIEIDDHVFRDESPDLDRFVETIAGLGVKLVVNDFGGGHASRRQLRRLPVHGVKIAADAIAAADRGEPNIVILKAETSLASALGIVIAGVGLDTADLVDRARDIGCHRGQGLHLGPPLPAEDVPSLLAQRVS